VKISVSSRIAFAPGRRQGFARFARRLTAPLTATRATAQQVVSSCSAQLLRSLTTGSKNTKFLTTPAAAARICRLTPPHVLTLVSWCFACLYVIPKQARSARLRNLKWRAVMGLLIDSDHDDEDESRGDRECHRSCVVAFDLEIIAVATIEVPQPRASRLLRNDRGREASHVGNRTVRADLMPS